MTTKSPAPKLLRLSDVARIFEVHPKTAYYWYRTGRIAAFPSPGGLLRVRAEDVRALAAQSGLSLPAELAGHETRLVVLEHRRGAARALLRAVKAKGLEIEVRGDWHDALLAVGRLSPSAFVIVGEPEGVDLGALVAAIRRNSAQAPIVVAAIATGGAGTEGFAGAGVDHVFEAGNAAALIATVTTAR